MTTSDKDMLITIAGIAGGAFLLTMLLHVILWIAFGYTGTFL